MKKLIPLVALLGLAGAAQAQVALYGLIDMSYGKNEIQNPGQKDGFFSGGDNGSSQGNSTTRVGLKGSTDVGSGVKANFKFETAGITSKGEVGTGGTPFFNRAAWVGFSGSFGEVRLGKQDSVAFQTMAGFDLNGAANAAAAQLNSFAGTWLGAGGRQDRSLQYISPDFSGFKAQLGFQPEGSSNIANTSLGLSYTRNKFAAAVAYESKRTDAGSNFGAISASYDLGVAKIMGGYTDGGSGQRGTTLGAVAPVGSFNVGLNYSVNSDSKAAATEFFVNTQLFKNTYAYFDYGNLDKTHAGWLTKGNAYALGVIYVF